MGDSLSISLIHMKMLISRALRDPIGRPWMIPIATGCGPTKCCVSGAGIFYVVARLYFTAVGHFWPELASRRRSGMVHQARQDDISLIFLTLVTGIAGMKEAAVAG